MSSSSQLQEQRFRESIIYMVSIYKWVLKDLEAKKLVNLEKINSVIMGAAETVIAKTDDTKLIELGIEKSLGAWIYAHYYDDNDKKANIEYLRNNFGVFLSEIPDYVCDELTRLSLLKDAKGEYVIGDAVVDRIHQAGLSMIKIALNYLESKGVSESRLVKMPIGRDGQLVEVQSRVCLYQRFSYVDIGYWRHYYPAKA